MPAAIIQPAASRMLPALTDANRGFWTGGSDGVLRVPRCDDCDRWLLPPPENCPACGGAVSLSEVSGRASLLTWTLAAHQFHPDVPPPVLIAIVVLAEQEDLRMATNLVDCEEGDLRAGLALSVLFEDHGEVFYPIFTPAAA